MRGLRRERRAPLSPTSESASGHRPPPARISPFLFGVVGAVAAGLPAFFLFFLVWPEIVVPAYFASRGGLLYETIYFPHTPLLILILAASGKIFGFSSLLFRSVVAASLAACGALLVRGVRPSRRGPSGPLAGLLVGVPLLVLWMIYTEGPMIWPEPFMAPLLLGAVLALERFETTGRRSALIGAGLLLGVAILIKQTAAWTVLSALLWALFVSRRRSFDRAGSLLAASAVPYIVFAIGWAIAFQTVSHLRWTLLIPISGGFAGEIATVVRGKVFLDSVSVFLVFPAILLLARNLPGSRVLRSPAPWVAIGVYGMAWPRWGLLHLAGATGIVGLTAARACLVAASRRRRRSRAGRKPVSFLFGGALLSVHIVVAVVAGGALAWNGLSGPAFWWDDPGTVSLAERVRARVKGGAFLNFYLASENLYAIIGSTTPDGTYVNASFWYLLNRNGVGDRLVASLSRRPGTLVLFREPGPPDWPLRETSLYRFLTTRTRVIEEVEPGLTWRIVQ
jgi:hypothetical protein